MNELERAFEAEVEDWRRRGLGRSLERPTHPIDFTSSDVLGFSRHPALVRAAREAVEAVLARGDVLTGDFGGTATTAQAASAVLAELQLP